MNNSNHIDYILHLADNTLILSQRNAEWCGHGPVLEQDIAITNISLDMLGQSRSFYQYAAELINKNEGGDSVTEDTLAHFRTEREFKNVLLAELPNGDWAQTILKQFLFSTYQYFLYQLLQHSSDTQLAAIAAKSLKEVTYHLRWSSEWVIRLGDGTDESHQRMLKAIDNLWMYSGELTIAAEYETNAAANSGGIDPATFKESFNNKITEIFNEANLPVPGKTFMQTGGKQGRHTEHLGFILTELQYLQRTYPGAEW